jgi:uncharacterized membrane protein YebE (DUF533 family)
MIALTRSETESILALCLMASFADGEKHERERTQIRKITDSLAGDELDVAALYQDVLLNKPDTATVAARLERPEARQLAYEMAVCVCDADEVRNESEKAFLKQLSDALALPSSATLTADTSSTSLTTISVGSATPPQSEETDAMILRYAIVGGALELLPQTMATLAIVPLQTKMVYRLSKQRGFELDQKSIAEFFESFARRLSRGLGKKVGGKLGGKIGDTVGGVAMSFASTYALGHLARLYYDSGRSLSITTLKSKYAPLLEDGKALAQKYTAQITQQSQQFQNADISTLMKGVP